MTTTAGSDAPPSTSTTSGADLLIIRRWDAPSSQHQHGVIRTKPPHWRRMAALMRTMLSDDDRSAADAFRRWQNSQSKKVGKDDATEVVVPVAVNEIDRLRTFYCPEQSGASPTRTSDVTAVLFPRPLVDTESTTSRIIWQSATAKRPRLEHRTLTNVGTEVGEDRAEKAPANEGAEKIPASERARSPNRRVVLVPKDAEAPLSQRIVVMEKQQEANGGTTSTTAVSSRTQIMHMNPQTLKKSAPPNHAVGSRSLRIINGQRVNSASWICFDFLRDGKCQRGAFCHYLHTTDQTATRNPPVCNRLLRGLCRPGNAACTLSHDLAPNQMPECTFFARGQCTEKDCKLLHVASDPGAVRCPLFQQGVCFKGPKCPDGAHIYTSGVIYSMGVFEDPQQIPLTKSYSRPLLADTTAQIASTSSPSTSQGSASSSSSSGSDEHPLQQQQPMDNRAVAGGEGALNWYLS